VVPGGTLTTEDTKGTNEAGLLAYHGGREGRGEEGGFAVIDQRDDP
jgi:hypothetical protein